MGSHIVNILAHYITLLYFDISYWYPDDDCHRPKHVAMLKKEEK